MSGLCSGTWEGGYWEAVASGCSSLVTQTVCLVPGAPPQGRPWWGGPGRSRTRGCGDAAQGRGFSERVQDDEKRTGTRSSLESWGKCVGLL